MKNEEIRFHDIPMFLDNAEMSWFQKNASGNMDMLRGTEDTIRLELIGIPMLARIICDQETIVFNLYLRHEIGILLDSPNISVSIDREGKETVLTDSGMIQGDPLSVVTVMIKTAIGIKEYLGEKNAFSLLAEADAEHDGIRFSLSDETMAYKKVSRRQRPDLKCVGLFGSSFSRPYQDEMMEGLVYDSMSLETKIQMAEDGDLDMMDRLAVLYANGDDETEPDPEKAVYWFRKLADAGVSNGMFNLGLYYAKGLGVGRDLQKAAYWMKRAAENGDDDGAALAEKYEKANADKKKAEEGDAQAQADYAGFLMEIGLSMGRDDAELYKEAVEWAERSAGQGNPAGMWVLALAYEHGRGVEEDKEKAIEWYRKGADLGHAPSMNSFACFCLREEVSGKTKEDAFELFKKAAELGNIEAMKNLGQCYQFEHGTDHDMKLAIYWYERYLEHRNDEELARKVMIFKTLPDLEDEEDPEEIRRRLEEKKRQEKKRKAEEERKRKEEERRRAEEEARRAEEEARAKAEAEQKAWEEEAERIKAARHDALSKRLLEIEESKSKDLTRAEAEKNRAITKCQEALEEITKSVAEMEAELSSLGLFAFGKKSELKKAIGAGRQRMQELASEKDSIIRDYQTTVADINRKAEMEAEGARVEVEVEYLIPDSPAEKERKRKEKSEIKRKTDKWAYTGNWERYLRVLQFYSLHPGIDERCARDILPNVGDVTDVIWELEREGMIKEVCHRFPFLTDKGKLFIERYETYFGKIEEKFPEPFDLPDGIIGHLAADIMRRENGATMSMLLEDPILKKVGNERLIEILRPSIERKHIVCKNDVYYSKFWT